MSLSLSTASDMFSAYDKAIAQADQVKEQYEDFVLSKMRRLFKHRMHSFLLPHIVVHASNEVLNNKYLAEKPWYDQYMAHNFGHYAKAFQRITKFTYRNSDSLNADYHEYNNIHIMHNADIQQTSEWTTLKQTPLYIDNNSQLFSISMQNAITNPLVRDLPFDCTLILDSITYCRGFLEMYLILNKYIIDGRAINFKRRFVYDLPITSADSFINSFFKWKYIGRYWKDSGVKPYRVENIFELVSLNSSIPYESDAFLEYCLEFSSTDKENKIIELFKTNRNNFDTISGSYIHDWTPDYIEKYKDKLNWNKLSLNPSLPFSIPMLFQYEDRWNWENLIHNHGLWENLLDPLLTEQVITDLFKLEG